MSEFYALKYKVFVVLIPVIGANFFSNGDSKKIGTNSGRQTKRKTSKKTDVWLVLGQGVHSGCKPLTEATRGALTPLGGWRPSVNVLRLIWSWWWTLYHNRSRIFQRVPSGTIFRLRSYSVGVASALYILRAASIEAAVRTRNMWNLHTRIYFPKIELQDILSVYIQMSETCIVFEGIRRVWISSLKWPWTSHTARIPAALPREKRSS